MVVTMGLQGRQHQINIGPMNQSMNGRLESRSIHIDPSHEIDENRHRSVTIQETQLDI